MENILNKAIVVFVWALILGLGIPFACIFMPALLQYNVFNALIFQSTVFYVIMLPFILIFMLLVISYGRVTCTAPGSPSQVELDQYKQNNQLQSLKVDAKAKSDRKRQLRQMKKYPGSKQQREDQEINQLKEISYCFKCENIKPLRVHHCKVCKKCILRMDHHCPWVGSCVGQNNHKYFILFLLYATLGLLVVGLSIAIDFFSGQRIISKLSENQRYGMYIVGVASLLLSLSIGFLLITQMIASMQNLTTLDTFISGIQRNNPFDTNSIYENLSQIFGKGGCWLLPTAPNIVASNQYVDHDQYYYLSD